MIKEVIFDIDNTIYDYDRGHVEGMRRMGDYVQEHFQIPREIFEKEYKEIMKEITERLGTDNAAIHSRSLRIQNFLERRSLPLFPHVRTLYRIYWGSLIKASQGEPGAAACMKELREMGISVGIGTDMTAMMQYEKLEAYGFAPYISHMVSSQEAGVEKPHKDFMELCIRKAGVLPEECLFVGDSFGKDVCGSGAAGMHPVWYNPKGKARPEEIAAPEKGYGEIRHFDQLIPYIKAELE